MGQVDFAGIEGLFRAAQEDGRQSLFEHECYEVLRLVGAESAPVFRFVDAASRPTLADLDALPGNKVVLKIVSPDVTHKSDVGGVRIVPKDLEAVTQVFERMLREVPTAWAARLSARPEHASPAVRDLDPEALASRVRGILLVGFVPSDATGFASELFVGVRNTAEFGPVITAGVGGVEMELLAERTQAGSAIALAPAGLMDGARFLEVFGGTFAYERISGRMRGARRIVEDSVLQEAFQAFIDVANHFSPANPEASFHLHELEVNPFVVCQGRLSPLDGVCSFGPPAAAGTPRPRHKIEHLVRPRSAAVIGVSEKGMNMGRIILRNLFAAGFPKDRAWVVRPGLEALDGVPCVPSIEALPEKVDLFVVAVGADQVPAVVEDLVLHDKANAVILIPGGLGEKEGSKALEARLEAMIHEAHGKGEGGPVFVGGNSMGVVSHPGRYDTFFIPEDKLAKSRGEARRNLAFISQSGAFVIANLSRMPWLDPLYALTIGNQIDLTAGDLLSFIKDESEVEVIAAYVEGFKDGDGLAFARAVREAVALGKDVVFYKAGRTREGRTATAGHTASVAGDYAVCEAALVEAGAFVARDFDEFGDLLRLCLGLRGKTLGGTRLAAMSNAGFEAVGMADAIKVGAASLSLPRLDEGTTRRLSETLAAHRLDGLVDAKNPLDVTPMAGDVAFCEAAGHLLADPHVDLAVVGIVPLTPAIQTLPPREAEGPSIDRPDSIAARLPALARESDKPLVAVVDSGARFDPLVARLEAGGLPVFRAADRAVRALVRWVDVRLARRRA